MSKSLDAGYPGRKTLQDRSFLFLLLFFPMLCAIFFCASQAGALTARTNHLDEEIDPSQTADYSPWEHIIFAPLNPQLATMITAEGRQPHVVAYQTTSIPAETITATSSVEPATLSPVDTATATPLVTTIAPPTATNTITPVVTSTYTETIPPPATGTATSTATTTITPTITMTATASATVTLTPFVPTATSIPLTVDIAVSKSVNNPAPIEGEIVIYQVIALNNGTGAATNVRLTDTLPSGLTFVAASATQGAYSSGVWTVGTLNAGGSVVLSISAQVNSGQAGATITNTVNLLAVDQPDTNSGNNSQSVSITVGGSTDLAVSQVVSNSSPIESGTIQYTITVSNISANTATGIHLTDMLPAGLTFILSAPSQGTYTVGSGDWNVGSLSGGAAATLRLTVVVNMGTAGIPIVNTAALTAVNETDSNASNNSASTTITSTAFTSGADLSVSISAAASVSEGSSITLTLSLTNNTAITVNGITVSHVFSSNLTYLSSIGYGTYSPGLWTVGSVGPGTTVLTRVTVQTVYGSGGTIATNSIGITTADQPDPVPSNNSASNTITIKTSGLSLTLLTDSSTALEGDLVRYRVFVYNYFGVTVNGIQVTDLIPAGLTFDSADRTTYDPVTGIWDVGSLAPGSSIRLIIYARVDAGTVGMTITDTATITAMDQVDPNPSNNTRSVSITITTVVPPPPGVTSDLRLTHTISGSNPSPGQLVILIITVTNDGPDTAANIQVEDFPPLGVTYQSYFSTNGSYDPALGLWTLSQLITPGSSAELRLRVEVDPGTEGQTITNTATITAMDQTDPNPGNNSASASLHVTGTDLALSKTVSNMSPAEGEIITYTLTLGNSGPDDAPPNIQVADLLPAGVIYLSHTASQGSYDSGTGIWDVGGLTASSSATLTISVQMAAGTTGGTITNTATITNVSLPDTNPANNSASATVVVQQPTDIQVTKTVDNPAPFEGTTIHYTITANNISGVAASGIALTDNLPAGLTFVSAASGQGSYDPASGIWAVGALSPGNVTSLTISASVNTGTAGLTISNSAALTALDQSDGNATNNSAAVNITVAGQIDLQLSKTAVAGTVNLSDTFDYQLSVSNLGSTTANSTIITDTLPPGIMFISSPDCTAILQDVTCNLGNISPGGGRATVITVQAVSVGLWVNTATTFAIEADPVLGNNISSFSVNVVDPWAVDYALSVVSSDNNPLPGSSVTLTLSFQNILPPGTANVDAIRVLVTLPPDLTYVSDTASQGTYDSLSGIWIFSYTGLSTITLDLMVNVSPSAAGLTLIPSVAIVNFSWANDGNAGNDSSSVNINVQ